MDSSLDGESEKRGGESERDGSIKSSGNFVSIDRAISDGVEENAPAENEETSEHQDHHGTTAQSQSEPPDLELVAGDRVCLKIRPPYFKTADPMTMLRPPDVVPVGENGTLIARRPGGYWAVRFPQGAFLIEQQHIRKSSHTAS